MTDKELSRSQGIAALFERVSRNIYPERGPRNLHARQWAALRFFDQPGVGQRARTVTGLSKYLGVTSAPASRSLASLVRLGYLEPEDTQLDRKTVSYRLTGQGRDMLAKDPRVDFADAIADLDDKDQEALTRILMALLDAQAK